MLLMVVRVVEGLREGGGTGEDGSFDLDDELGSSLALREPD